MMRDSEFVLFHRYLWKCDVFFIKYRLQQNQTAVVDFGVFENFYVKCNNSSNIFW